MRPASKPPLDDNTVAEFLANNGDFLVRRPELLPDIPAHQDSGSGAVVSLAERQVAALRKRNLALRDRLATLLEVARDNDRTFARMRELTLGLMDAANAIELNRLLARHLLAEFRADHAICFVRRSPSEDLAHLVARVAKAPWDRVFDHAAPTCGAYRAEEYSLLFPAANLGSPGSAAVVPMHRVGATLAIGSKDPTRFSADAGTLFLTFLGDVLERTLMRLKL